MQKFRNDSFYYFLAVMCPSYFCRVRVI